MNALIWTALWTLAVAALCCGLQLLSVPPLRARAALAFARSPSRRRRLTRED